MTELPTSDPAADPVHGAHLRHRKQFDPAAAQPVEARAYSWGYEDGFDAALALPIDHPLLEGIKEKLRADGWNPPSCVETGPCGELDHTFARFCDLASEVQS